MSRRLAATLLAGCVAAPLLFRSLPSSVFESGVELCLFKLAFGITCPGCGMTRALYWLLNFDLHRAIAFNWRVVIVAPILAGMWMKFALSLLGVLRRSGAKVSATTVEPAIE